MRFGIRCKLICVALVLALLPVDADGALTPDQIALVVNRHEPQGRQLAEFYAQGRQIPLDRIIELDLPTTEEMPFDRYERSVRPVLRRALRDRGLNGQVRCLVTFYGVPLRVAGRVNNLLDNQELARLRSEQQRLNQKLAQMVHQIEQRLEQMQPSFKPASEDVTLEDLARRLEHVGNVLEKLASSDGDAALKASAMQTAADLNAMLAAPFEPPQEPAAAPAPPAATSAASSPPATELQPDRDPEPRNLSVIELAELLEHPYDPQSRAVVRGFSRRFTGILSHARVLQAQIDYLTPDATEAALDSELALLWWPAYSRVRWQPNLLNLHVSQVRAPPTLMVMRLDGPTPQIVRDIIANSIVVERQGLKGRFVIDARGLAARDTHGNEDQYGLYDDRLRRLAAMVHARTDLEVRLDDQPQVIAANSVDDVALYCGWYSVRNYVPGMKFNPGAVGYHIASFELVSLRGEKESGWVRGLLYAGVAGTLGPVAEPYLQSFPPPDEFFPLLLTGQLTLAEVYWATVPMTSWMLTCIGDPLYRPFATNPAMELKDLPPSLRSRIPTLFEAKPTSIPALTAPGF
ncbi:MAG TPA: TIGR03790 family protein [Tepidisphaeraceae bacterium]|nr:TIGR03790 family protein [Tepidisphaeraceae bacterium]